MCYMEYMHIYVLPCVYKIRLLKTKSLLQMTFICVRHAWPVCICVCVYLQPVFMKHLPMPTLCWVLVRALPGSRDKGAAIFICWEVPCDG